MVTMTREEALEHMINEMLLTSLRANLISDWEFRNIDRDALKAVFKNIKDAQLTHEEKRLWKIRICGSALYNIYYTDVRELTESEAVKWYSEYNTLTLRKEGIFYKKDGEWVIYETN